VPSSQYNYREPAWVQNFLTADREKKLRTKDRDAFSAMRSAVRLSPRELEEILGQEVSVQNRTDLVNAFTDSRDPEIISILGEELEKIRQLRSAVKEKTIEAKQETMPALGDIHDILQAVFKY
jgi:hypothetical protein